MVQTLTPHGVLDSIDPIALAEQQRRLSDEQALAIYTEADLHTLGEWARAFLEIRHRQDHRSYVIDRNINYTNVCTAHCTFCAFKRNVGSSEGYVLENEMIYQKIQELVSIGGTQILMQGGMNPELGLDYYLDLLSGISERFPQVHIHAFSPPEFVEFVRFFRMDLREILTRFQQAGLKTIPGGGGEIFADRVRKKIGIGKCSGDEWLNVMRTAHELGMKSSATMLIGHIETIKERIDHMARIRRLQDETGGFTAFIHWPFQPENTPLARMPHYDPQGGAPFDGSTLRLADAQEYLRMLALARLYLDNVEHMQSSWVTMGPKIGQLALYYGADDMGSVMMEENVVSSAGTTFRLTEREICRLIRDVGWIPAQRDQYYNILKRHDGPNAPDLRDESDQALTLPITQHHPTETRESIE